MASNRKQTRPPVEKVVEKPVEKPVEPAAPVVEAVQSAQEKVEAEPVKPQKQPKRDKPASQPRTRDKAKGADNEGLRELGKSIDWSSAPETDMARALREALTGKKESEN